MPKFLDKIVIASIGLTILGGLIAVIFQWVTGMELSPTLIQYWFTVFGIELGATTLITLTKTLTKTYEKKVELQTWFKWQRICLYWCYYQWIYTNTKLVGCYSYNWT